MFKMPRIPQPPTVAALVAIGKGVQHIVKDLHALKEQVMATKDEVLAQIADVKTLLGEVRKDVGRVADKLDEAVANSNLDDVAAAVADLRGVVQDIDDRAETASPEPAAPVEEPTEPTP